LILGLKLMNLFEIEFYLYYHSI